jgi:hypothetical protein
LAQRHEEDDTMGWKLSLGVIGLLLSIAGVPLSSVGAQTQSEQPGSQVVRLVAKEAASKYLDLGRKGFGQSDQFVFTNDLVQADTKVGQDGGTCTVTRITARGANTWFCVASNSLPGGQITVEGLVTYGPREAVKAEPYYFAITGGTGDYQGAEGQVKLEEVSATVVRVTLQIEV